MKISFVLSIVSLLTSCLIFTSGCQNESAATEHAEPSQVLYEAPPKARSLSISEHFEMDRLVTDQSGSFDSKQVNWEEDNSQGSKKKAPPNLDEIFNIESTELGKLSGDGTEKDDFLK